LCQNIGKPVGLKPKIIARMEQEGLVQPAGVAGYKLVDK
jgi:hypothetical protein